MIWFEWKKILNGRVLLCFVVIHLAFLMLFWTQNSSVQKGRNTAKQQEIASYVFTDTQKTGA